VERAPHRPTAIADADERASFASVTAQANEAVDRPSAIDAEAASLLRPLVWVYYRAHPGIMRQLAALLTVDAPVGVG
jgi:hypothetical protein